MTQKGSYYRYAKEVTPRLVNVVLFDSSETTTLMWASRWGNYDIVQYLLEQLAQLLMREIVLVGRR